MGQAKQRGSLAERIADAPARQRRLVEAEIKQHREREHQRWVHQQKEIEQRRAAMRAVQIEAIFRTSLKTSRRV